MIFLQNDIILYENFLDEKQCKSIIDILEYKMDIGEYEWQPISFYESYTSRYPDNYDPDLEKFQLTPTFFTDLEKRVKLEAEKLIGGPAYKISFHTQKWAPGSFAHFHSDNSYDGKPSAFHRSKYAGFIYLNDDFEGGALNFKDKPISIAPKTGSFVLFSGGGHNMHEVSTVKNKNRYTVGSFWDDKPEEYYDHITKEDWAKELEDTRNKQKIEQEEWEDLRKRGLRMRPDGTLYNFKEETQ